jgi:glycine cleavage system H protein
MRPNDRSFMKSHEWCKIDDGIATIGISDHAVSHLSDLVFLDLPQKGTNVTAGESFGEIESVKAVSDLYSPVSGEVVEINKDLPDNLDWLAAEPYGKAWMMKVKVTGKSPDLMDSKAYDAHCAAEG